MSGKVVAAAVITAIALSFYSDNFNVQKIRLYKRHGELNGYSNVIGSNRDKTYCAITKGSCPSSGNSRITHQGDICVERAISRHGVYSLDGCVSEDPNDMSMSITLLTNATGIEEEFQAISSQRANLHLRNQCQLGSCQCTEMTPCICETQNAGAFDKVIRSFNEGMTKRDEIFLCDDPSQTLVDYFDVKKSIRNESGGTFSETTITRQIQEILFYLVVWNIDLEGKESLLESPYLKAGFEQSIKDYINNKADCLDGVAYVNGPNEPNFYDFEIPYPSQTREKSGLSGTGRCRGNKSSCQSKLKETVSDAGIIKNNYKHAYSWAAVNNIFAAEKDDEFCAAFSNTDIFDSLKDRILQASSFSYNIEVNVASEFLAGETLITTNVTFLPVGKNGLNEIKELGLTPDDPKESRPNCNVAQCLSQRDTVERIFQYFDLPFTQGKHECAFQGINCDKNELITYMFLEKNNFTGLTIPADFQHLPSLKGLFLGGNQLVGTIPHQFQNIKSLEMLWLENNNLEGQIPANLSKLENLIQMNLFNNNFTGTLPGQFLTMPKLEMLELGNNSISGPFTFVNIPEVDPPPCDRFPRIPILQWLYDLLLGFLRWISSVLQFEGTDKKNLSTFPSNLTILSLDNNLLTGTIPILFSSLSNLKELVLSNNKLTGVIPSQLGTLENLIVADLRANSLFGSVPSELGNLNNLEVLNLYGNKLEKSLPTEVGNLLSLKELILDNNIFTGAIPSEVGKLVNIKYFTFMGNRMAGTFPSEIGNMVNTEFIDFRNYRVSAQTTTARSLQTTNESPCLPESFGNLIRLSHIITSPDNGLEGPLPESIGNLASIKVMWLDDQKITGDLPESLFQLESITVFTIDNNEISGAPFEGLSTMTSLTVLSLKNNVINDTITESIGSLVNLQVLDIADNEDIGGALAEYVVDLPLTVVNAANTPISGDIVLIVQSITTIAVLNLGNTSVTGNLTGVQEIGQLLDLTTFIVGNTKVTGSIAKNITDTQLAYLDIGNTTVESIPEELGDMESFQILMIDNTDIKAAFWMCRLQSLTLKQFEEAKCDDFCGQKLEQCNDDASAASAANCETTGCTGGGVPSCTSTCKIDYTSCKAGPDQLNFTLGLKFEDKPLETNWNVVNLNNDEIVKNKNQTYTNYRSYTEYFCLADSNCYAFTIFDSGKDGLCQISNADACIADYELNIDGKDEPSNPFFPAEAYTPDIDIGTCTAAPTPAPIPGVAPVPTPPTSSFTLYPTKAPTSYPISTPSLQPSSSPSLESYEVVVTINFDFFVGEISWVVTNGNNETVKEADYSPAETLPYATNVTSFILDGGICYTFTISDSAGDGLSYGERNYDYDITVNGVAVEGTDPDFGFQANHALGNYCVS